MEGVLILKYLFKIADICFDVNGDFEINWNPIIERFLVNVIDHVDYTYQIHICKKLPDLTGKLIYQTSNQYIYQNKYLESRLYFLPLYHYPMIVYQELDDKNRKISILEDYVNSVRKPESFSIFNALSAEKMFYEHNAFVLHSSFIVYNGYAILFSAPSGTGKSTQAHLWLKYKDAKIINEDRTLIKKEGNMWYGYGMPICGSSKICINEKAPIKTVVYLSQYHKNIIEKLSVSVKVKKLISETTINFWNKQFLDNTVSLIEDFSKNITMYHLACQKDKEAVDLLLKTLEGEL